MQIQINDSEVTIPELVAAFRTIGFKLTHKGLGKIEANPIPEPEHRVLQREESDNASA